MKSIITNQGPNFTEAAIQRAARSVTTLQAVIAKFDQQSNVPPISNSHSTKSLEQDVAKVVIILKSYSVFIKYYLKAHDDIIAQKNAWVDSGIFSEWLHKEFLPSVKKHMSEKSLQVKALLLLDNAPAHPDESVLLSSDKSIKAMFLPPNTTALIQPMDQGELESLKRRYQKSLLRKLLLLDQEGDSMITFVKKINVKDAI